MAKSTDTTLYTYNKDATAKCTNCGTIYNLGSTIASFSTEICGNCHPFYTGKEVLVDTAGRIEKFNVRMSKASDTQSVKKTKVRKSIQSIGELAIDEPAEESVKPKLEKAKQVAPKSEVVAENPKTIAEVQTPTQVDGNSTTGDDLVKIEGIGPKAAEELIKAGIVTFVDLAKATYEQLKEILDKAESKVQHLDPVTWAQQAQLAADGKWEELDTLQKELNGGK